MSGQKPESVPDWTNTIVLFSTPLLAIIFVPYHWLVNGGFTIFEWSCFAFFMVATGTGITAGYHRLWSHKAYDANVLVRLWYAYWGACATQNSILKWSADHRRHHKYVDHLQKDPYSAKKGFWWAHMGWILERPFDDQVELDNVKDLEKDWVVIWQEKLYVPLVLFSNIVVPIALGFIYQQVTGSGSLFGVLVLAGLLRFVLNHHFTFFINSACHFFGNQPYSIKDTSRDNFFLALFTYGEGYHNYHHTFQADYRNGIRWYHFDPTKWITKALSYIGFTWNLKKIPECQIEKQKLINKMNIAKENLYTRLDVSENQTVSQKIEQRYKDFTATLNEWMEAENKFSRFCKDKRSALEKEPYMARLKSIRKTLEVQKEQLQKLFQAPDIDTLLAY
ncbi:MAG: fatty acid desaturase [Lentisphaeraceae bacterium]|nr:fatty acid desaturase [Lentisphaeraceae bacterium]